MLIRWITVYLWTPPITFLFHVVLVLKWSLLIILSVTGISSFPCKSGQIGCGQNEQKVI